jgi:hypothetical protein
MTLPLLSAAHELTQRPVIWHDFFLAMLFFGIYRSKPAPGTCAFNPHSPDNALSFGAACAIQI